MEKKSDLVAVDYRELELRYASLSNEERQALEDKRLKKRDAERERELTRYPRILTNRKARRAKAAILRKRNKP